MGDVSVVIVNWNAGPLLLRCLAALEAQTEPPREILVIDNASGDGSVAKLRTQYPRVTVIRNDRNVGFAAASNAGARMAVSEWIAFLNPDAFPASDWLEKLTKAARSRGQGVAYGCLQLSSHDVGVIDGTGDAYHVSGRVWRARKGRPASTAPQQMGPIFSACAAAALYRKKEFLDAGGFDEDFFCYLEDVDLGFRWRLGGKESYFVPDAIVYHAASATSGGQHSDFAVYHGHRNLVWVYVKNMPGLLFWAYLPYHLLLNIASVVYFILRGQGRTIVRAKRDALRGLPEILRRRREVQAGRTVKALDIRKAMARGCYSLLARR